MIKPSRLSSAFITKGISISTASNCTRIHRRLNTMATARTIQITPENTGLWHQKQTEAAAQKATALLQEDLEKHHCYFNKMGFHNHISHHLLSLYGVGASPEDIQKGYDDNANYQRSPYKVHPDQVAELKDFSKAKQKLGKEEFYTDFLVFFQSEIDKKGWKDVLDDYLFNGDERSEDLLLRMFEGFMHPLIQLMYGIEWQQPAIVAMGLAQAAVHGDNMKSYLLAAEEAARKSSDKMPHITALLTEVTNNEKLAKAAALEDGNKIRDGVLARAYDEAISVSAKVKVGEDELEKRTVEMYNAAVYLASAAAIREGKEPRFDFFLMHHVNVGPIFLAINSHDWIPTATKVRMLEWKIRFDLMQHAARACAPISLEKIESYVPKKDVLKPRNDLLPRIYALHDDGHVCKLIRALGVCQDASKKYEDQDWIPIKGDETWTKLHQLVTESAEGEGPRWVRGAGDAEAWKEIPDRK
ncbi:HypA protein [Astrocystis sublimbata]|nr:HypA protein [Astrocystis sublimbata]